MDDHFQADLFATPDAVEEAAPTAAFVCAGARDRASVLRRRMIAHGPRSLMESETLELLLALCGSSRWDPGRLAEALLARFGALPRVFGATLPELALIVGEPLAVELRLLHDLTLRVLEFPIGRRCLLNSWGSVRAYLKVSLGDGAAKPSTSCSSTGPTS
jgi:DNA repair protein RadC